MGRNYRLQLQRPGTLNVAAAAGSFSLSGAASGLVRTRRVTAGAGAFAMSGAAAALAKPPFPLSIHASGRYLVDVQGNPFPLFLESGWEHARLVTSGQREYIDAMVSRGFTALLNEGPLSLKYTPSGDDYGNPYFNTSGGSGSQGAPIFDITTPNTAAFQNLRAAMLYASSVRVCSFFYPAYAGFTGTQEGILDAVLAASDAQCEAYGVYVGNLIKDIPGVIVVLGADIIPNSTGLEKYRRMTVGIKSVDMAGRIYTWHAARTQKAWDVDATTAGYIAALGVPFLDTAYPREYGTLSTTHDECLTSYAAPHPVQVIEGRYEHTTETNADAVLLRRQFWGAWLSGALGSAFGDENRYGCDVGWQSTLTSPGLAIEAVDIAFLRARAWHLLVPSTGSGLVTSGGGTRNTLGYKPRALASDGSWGVVHVVDGSATTVAFSGFSGTKTVKWLDPTNGSLSTVGTHANSGTQAYTPGGNNAAGSPDWVLVIE